MVGLYRKKACRGIVIIMRSILVGGGLESRYLLSSTQFFLGNKSFIAYHLRVSKNKNKNKPARSKHIKLAFTWPFYVLYMYFESRKYPLVW